MKHLVLALSLLANPAFADVGCPTTDQGHPLARNDGGSLYVGNPAAGQLIAPTQQARSRAENNVWQFDGSRPITLVCQYQGSTRALARSIPAETRQCVQNFTVNTFACN